MRRLTFLVLALAVPAPASAHIVYGTATLHQLVSRAELVVRARIVDANDWLGGVSAALHRPAVRALPLEVIKGRAPESALRFTPHGESAQDYQDGDEVLLFLEPIERRRELAALSSDTEPRFVSVQEHDSKVLLTTESRPVWLKAARSYAALRDLPDDAARSAALRSITLGLLRSGDARLAGSAVLDLLALAEQGLAESASLEEFLPLVHDPGVSAGARVGLLVLLEQWGIADPAAHWVGLLRETRGKDRFTAMRGARTHPSPELTAELLRLLGSDEVRVATEAAVALGGPGHRGAEQALGRALQEGAEGLRMAAIRGLGGIASPAARQQLERAAASHEDPRTARRARAELYRLDR